MGKFKPEKVKGLLSTASMMESKEDMSKLIASAMIYLLEEDNPVSGVRFCADMIYGGVLQLFENLPKDGKKDGDSLQVRAQKILICQSAVAQIKEYVKEAEKHLDNDTIESVEKILKENKNMSLFEFEEAKLKARVIASDKQPEEAFSEAKQITGSITGETGMQCPPGEV